MNALAQRLAELSPEDRTLLLDRLREKGRGAQRPLLARRACGEDMLPLSFAQQRLWFLEQLEPGTAVYNLCLATKLTSVVDVVVMRRALNEVVARHEALRTSFAARAGCPFQLVAEKATLPFEAVDLTSLPALEREPALRACIAAAAGRPFDLSAGPLIRALLVHLTLLDHVLVVTMHHIVSDGWSMRVLMAEIGALYQAYRFGLPSPLPDLPVQYPDFSLWQRELLTGPLLDEQLHYWRARLGGTLPLLDLPADRPRPAVQGYAGATEHFRLPKELSDALVQFSRLAGASLFMTMLAACKALLARYSGQTDVLVGTPIAGRTRPEIEGLIGFFVNTLALRTGLQGDPTFRECVERVRETALGAYAHQDLPFERLVEELQPARGLSRPPIFQVMFVLQNPAEAQPEVPAEYKQLAQALTSGAESFSVPSSTAKFDLTLSLMETPGGLVGTAEYNTDLFETETVRRLIGHYQRILEAITQQAGAELRLSELPLMTEDEQREVLAAGCGPELGEPLVPVTSLMSRCAARFPDAGALCGSEPISYAELERRSTCLAQRLRAAGVQAGVPVAVCLPRDVQAVIALVAIWKAGGTYLPLDPGYPEARLAFMLADARVPLLLTNATLASTLPASGARIFDVDEAGAETSAVAPCELPEPDLDGVAYIIYTSGSTGRPKGVEVLHRGLSNLIQSELRLFGLGPGRRVLQFASPSFDAALLETVLALAAGAELHLAGRDALHPGQPLVDLLSERRITDVTLSPSVLASLPDEGLSELQVVIAAGESCPADVAARWSRGRRFFNGYGPTETTVCATIEEHGGSGPPPIGRPLHDVRAYVLDERRRLVPYGIAGELYIGGAGVARGYVGAPDLTADRFVPDPFSATPGARMYRSGDRARLRADGRFEFLGRLDAQVKLRGQRIELGEIEVVLREHASVAECVVVLKGEPPRGPQLVAYVVLRAGTRAVVDSPALRQHLGARLPAHMLPSVFVPLATLPLTPNGKLDREALPAAEPSSTAVEPSIALAPTQQRLAQVWSDLLQREHIGADDDFFALGGHSLLVAQLAARVRTVFDVELPLRRVFEASSLARMATVIESLREPQTASTCASNAAIALRTRGSEPPLFCVHPGNGHVSGYAALARRLDGRRPVYAFEAPGLEPGEEPLADVPALAARHVEQLLRARPQGPHVVAGWSSGGVIAFEMARQLEHRGAAPAALVQIDTYLNPRARRNRMSDENLAAFEAFGLDLGFAPDVLLAVLARLAAVAPPERCGLLVEHGRKAGLVPGEWSLASVERRFAVFAAQLTGLGTYAPMPITTPLVFLRAAERTFADPVADWYRLTTGRVTLVDVPGNHYTLMREPHVATLVAALERALSPRHVPAPAASHARGLESDR